MAPGTSLADRYRLGVARSVFLHFLSQDDRLRPKFAALSKTLRHAAARKALEAARRHHGFTERQERLAARRLIALVGRGRKRMDEAVRAIAREVLHLDAPWIRYELAIAYMRYLGLFPIDPSERSPVDEPAPRRVRIDYRPFPGETIAQARGAVLARVNALLPLGPDHDGSRSPRDGARHLADYVWWFYLRRGHSVSERQIAREIARTSRARVGKGVSEVERLFGLIQ